MNQQYFEAAMSNKGKKFKKNINKKLATVQKAKKNENPPPTSKLGMNDKCICKWCRSEAELLSTISFSIRRGRLILNQREHGNAIVTYVESIGVWRCFKIEQPELTTCFKASCGFEKI